MEPIDYRRRIRALEAEIRRLGAQNRRLGDDCDWAEEQVRVLRRLVGKLLREKDREDT